MSASTVPESLAAAPPVIVVDASDRPLRLAEKLSVHETGTLHRAVSSLLADPAVPVSKCAQVGNPHVESLGANDRQPLAFANLIASVGSESHGRIQATLVDRGKQEPAVDYPAGDSALAGDWNRAAVANNRVAIVVTAR